jgi:hypothetical protein
MTTLIAPHLKTMLFTLAGFLILMGAPVHGAQYVEDDSSFSSGRIVRIDTLYVVEVTAPRPEYHFEAPTVRSGIQEAEPLTTDLIRQETTIQPPNRRWAWMVLGVGTALASYMWLSSNSNKTPQQGTLRVTIENIPENP